MSHFDNLGLEKAVNDGQRLTDEGLRLAAALARILRTIRDSSDQTVEAAFWRTIDAATVTAREAVGRATSDAKGREGDLDRQEAVSVMAACALGEASDRSEIWAQQLTFAARTLRPDETGPHAHEAGLQDLEDIGRPAHYFMPNQIS